MLLQWGVLLQGLHLAQDSLVRESMPCSHSPVEQHAGSCPCRAAVQAGGFAYLLFLFSQGVDGYFEGQAMPAQYTAHNITITVRTIVRGLSYLCTFIFAANAVGLSGAAAHTFPSPKPRLPAVLLGMTEVLSCQP